MVRSLLCVNNSFCVLSTCSCSNKTSRCNSEVVSFLVSSVSGNKSFEVFLHASFLLSSFITETSWRIEVDASVPASVIIPACLAPEI